MVTQSEIATGVMTLLSGAGLVVLAFSNLVNGAKLVRGRFEHLLGNIVFVFLAGAIVIWCGICLLFHVEDLGLQDL